MNVKELVSMGRQAVSPEYTHHVMQGKTAGELHREEQLVTFMLRIKNVRLPFIIALNMDTNLSQNEKVGVLYFTALVTKADEAIDTSKEFASPLARTELKKRLLNQDVWDTGLTITDLIDQTLAHFPEEKQKIVTLFLDTMLTVHADRPKQFPKEYSYDDALAYRKATDNAWMEATLKLVDLETDPARIEKYQRVGILFQHTDDIKDWVEDAEDGSPNLFIGLATDLAPEHPEELEALMDYVATPDEQRPKQSIKSWLREKMPHTRKAYAQKYRELMNQTSGFTKSIFWGIGKTI